MLNSTHSLDSVLLSLQRVVVKRFQRRGDAEDYVHLLRRYTSDGNFIIMFEPLSELNVSGSLESEKIDHQSPYIKSFDEREEIALCFAFQKIVGESVMLSHMPF